MRTIIAGVVAAALAGGAASAQVVIDPGGVRSGGVVIDSTGVHTPGAEVTSHGVTTRTARTVRRASREASNAGLTISANHTRRKLDCRGGAATILGNHNTLTLIGCSQVSTAGNWNHLTVGFSEGGALSLTGNHNAVTWSAPAGRSVQVSDLGSANVVSRG